MDKNGELLNLGDDAKNIIKVRNRTLTRVRDTDANNSARIEREVIWTKL